MVGKSLILAIVGLTFRGHCLFAQTANSEQQVTAHSRQAQQDLKINRPDLAIREFKAIVALDPNNVVAQGDLGALLYFQGNYQDAVEHLRFVVNRQPSLWNTVMLLGMCEKRLGNLAAARSNLEQAFPKLTADKLRVQAGMELTELYYASRDLESAADVLKLLRKLKPDDPAILYTAHRVYSEQADEAALSVAMVAPKSAWMHELIAEEMVVQGKNDAAILHYREALKIDDRLPGAHFELGEVLSSASSAANKEQATKEYMAALEQNPFDEKSECRLGKIALGRSDLKEAYARYSRALQLQADDPDANLGLGTVLVSMNEPQKALPLLENAAKLDPSDAVTHYHLGTLYRKMGRMDDSRRELAEFQHLKQMKGDLKEIFRGMRFQNKLDENEEQIAQ